MKNLLSNNVRIVQMGKGRTGSTLLVNILIGLFCPKQAVYFASEDPAKENVFIKNFIIKSHTIKFREYINKFNQYDLYFIESTRNGLMVKIPTGINHISIDYSEFANDSLTLNTSISNVANKLIGFLPDNIINFMNLDFASNRIKNMNHFYEKNLKNISWGPETDYMYGLHGSHRNRDKTNNNF